MILEPYPEIIVIDEPDMTGGSAPNEIEADNFTLAISNDSNGHPVYTVTKNHQIVFTAKNRRYTFNIQTICKTTYDKKVELSANFQYASVENLRVRAPQWVAITLNFNGSSASESYENSTLDTTWYSHNGIKTTTLDSFFVGITHDGGGNEKLFEFKNKINNGTYKRHHNGDSFNGVSGFKQFDGVWHHFSYYGEDVIDKKITITCKEKNTNSNNDKEEVFYLSVPFSDNPLSVWLPSVDLSVINITENSFDFTINSDYDFHGSTSGILSLMKMNSGTLTHIEYIEVSFQKSDLPLTSTVTTHLDAGATYYLGGFTISYNTPSYYDLNHTVTVTNGNQTISKIPITVMRELSLRVDDYNLPVVTDDVLYDEDNDVYYGGYGVNAVPFSYAETPVTNIQLSNSVSDIDLIASDYTGFTAELSVAPTNFTRSSQAFIITSSNANVVGVKTNGGSSLRKVFNATENTNISLYARSAGTSTITIESEQYPSIFVSFTVMVHVPPSSIDTATPQAKPGVRTVLSLSDSANTYAGTKKTTDRILRIVEKSENIRANISSDGSQISIVSPPLESDVVGVFRNETVKCAIGDEYNGVTVERNMYYNISLEVTPSARAELFDTITEDPNKPSLVSSVLSFDSIRQMFNNLVPIMNGLNAICRDENDNERWVEVNTITKEVDVDAEYKMSFSELLTQLSNLETDIKNIITPVSNYLIQKDSSYFEAHSQERAIRDAISVLYPQYPNNSLDDISTASFTETLVTGNDKINRHEFIQTRYEWCNRMINALNV